MRGVLLEDPTDYVTAYEGYEWSAVGVWKREDGYYVATDGGCSCNYAWDSAVNEEYLVGPLSYEDMETEVRSLTAPDTGWYTYEQDEVEAMLEGLK